MLSLVQQPEQQNTSLAEPEELTLALLWGQADFSS